MSKDWFENALRDKYPAEAHDFDTDAAWTALEARRRKKRRRPFVFWWTSALGILLLGAAGIALWHSGDDRTPADPIINKRPVEILNDKSPVAATKTPRNLVGIGTNATRQTDRQAERVALFVATTPPPAPPPKRSGDVTIHPYRQMKNMPIENDSRLFSSSGNESNLRHPSPSGESLSRTLVGRPGVPSPELQHPFLALPSLLHDIQPLKTPAAVFPEIPAFIPGEHKKLPKSKELRWWIGASAHYGLSVVSRSGSVDYLKKRDSEETSLDMFQVGLDVRRYLNPRFFLQSGVYFTQWTDMRERSFKESFTMVDSNYLIARLIKADGTIEDVYGTADIVHTRTVTEETYNRYSLVELPLLAGISWPVGEHWRLDGALGPVFGLLSTRSGAISGDQIGTNLPLENAPYRNSATFSGMMRLEWLYATRDWSAGLGIMGRMALNDWAETNPLFSEKRHAFGAGLVFRKALR